MSKTTNREAEPGGLLAGGGSPSAARLLPLSPQVVTSTGKTAAGPEYRRGLSWAFFARWCPGVPDSRAASLDNELVM